MLAMIDRDLKLQGCVIAGEKMYCSGCKKEHKVCAVKEKIWFKVVNLIGYEESEYFPPIKRPPETGGG